MNRDPLWRHHPLRRHIERLVATLPADDSESRLMAEVERAVVDGRETHDQNGASTWFATLHALEEFTRRETRLPMRFALSAIEVSLAVWLHRERELDHTPYQNLRLLRYVENVDLIVGTWWAFFAAVERFVVSHDRLPSPTSSDVEENILGTWLARQGDRRGQKAIAIGLVTEHVFSVVRRAHRYTDRRTFRSALAAAGFGEVPTVRV